ncbi:Ribosomal lysine N-methyltransferase 4 [Gnomoniopsis smithogilvyi]|uniref:Ribosomal lysine N-methyltransferase 4 n=1 Tax=Gnomoniopsis smithogilvyi TaxID=1191159 RepID=A0A9W9CVN4_9PEZI|nr:Ribosomal lysine N-methyltransferase 4 [Gnomoniopsis smithogilvyi]
MSGDPFITRTNEFLNWFKSQPGTTFHNDIEIVDLRSRGAGRGIIATADIPPDTVLFTIPRDTIISKETSSLVSRLPQIFETSVPQDVDHDMDGDDDPAAEVDTSQDSWTTLILILIHEHLLGAASRWAPYLAILPEGPADFNTPMFWTDVELAELQASPVVSKVGRDEAEAMIRTKILPVVRAHADAFFPPDSQVLTDDELIQLAFRMGSVIMAYAFDLEKEDDDDEEGEEGAEDEWVEDREGRSTLGMVAMADVLNADTSFNTHIEHGENALTATTLREIKKGEEVLNYYGPLSNGELLRRYGYVTTAHERWNLVDLSWESILAVLKGQLGVLKEGEWEKVLGALDEDEMEESFVIEYGAKDPDSEGRVEDVSTNASVPEELVEQAKEILKVVKKVREEAVPDKTARDRVIYSAIATAIDERTKEYSTTLDQDQMLYQNSNDWSQRKRMAVFVRMGEKRILMQAAQQARQKLAILEIAARDGDGRSAKRRKL